MAVREVITVGEPRLRKRSKEVEKITPELRALIADMIETMETYEGVGLAAVQVGELVSAIIVEVPENEDIQVSGERHVVINPEIVKASQETEVGIEGCLSIPGYVGEVERSTSIVVRGWTSAATHHLRPKASSHASSNMKSIIPKAFFISTAWLLPIGSGRWKKVKRNVSKWKRL
jgi:peptide deformylase